MKYLPLNKIALYEIFPITLNCLEMVRKSISFDCLISRHFETILDQFRNILLNYDSRLLSLTEMITKFQLRFF